MGVYRKHWFMSLCLIKLVLFGWYWERGCCGQPRSTLTQKSHHWQVFQGHVPNTGEIWWVICGEPAGQSTPFLEMKPQQVCHGQRWTTMAYSHAWLMMRRVIPTHPGCQWIKGPRTSWQRHGVRCWETATMAVLFMEHGTANWLEPGLNDCAPLNPILGTIIDLAETNHWEVPWGKGTVPQFWETLTSPLATRMDTYTSSSNWKTTYPCKKLLRILLRACEESGLVTLLLISFNTPV